MDVYIIVEGGNMALNSNGSTPVCRHHLPVHAFKGSHAQLSNCNLLCIPPLQVSCVPARATRMARNRC